MKKLKIGILGSSGRMGQEVQSVVKASGHSLGPLISSDNFKKFLSDKKNPGVDVWIDFSTPEVLTAFLNHLDQFPTALVSGTTGVSQQLMAELKKRSKKSSVFWAPNMSLGIAIVTQMIESFRSLNDFDFQIDEAHHKHKKDSPSGTAILLQNKLQEVVGKKKLPKPLSTRGGGVYGVHRIQALSDEEVISIEHTALNRQVFAKGALWAALKIKDLKPGFYEMKDLLKT
jgi:4-hydroxy-tetrahydrodipicolinate reductase